MIQQQTSAAPQGQSSAPTGGASQTQSSCKASSGAVGVVSMTIGDIKDHLSLTTASAQDRLHWITDLNNCPGQTRRQMEGLQKAQVAKLITDGDANWVWDPLLAQFVLVNFGDGLRILGYDGLSPIVPTPPTLPKNPFPKKQFLTELEKLEGTIVHMYLDTTGNVTIGTGMLLDTVQKALNLKNNMEWKANAPKFGQPLTDADIRAEYTLVSQQSYGQSVTAKSFDALTHIRLKPGIANAQLTQDARDHLAAVLTGKPFFDSNYFDTYPTGAQMAIADIAYNVGRPKMHPAASTGFPKFINACWHRDWSLAKTHISRAGLANRDSVVKGWMDGAINAEPFFIDIGDGSSDQPEAYILQIPGASGNSPTKVMRKIQRSATTNSQPRTFVKEPDFKVP